MKYSNILIAIAVATLLGLALLVDWVLTAPQTLPLLIDGELTDAKSKAIDVMITRSNLIANWNIGTVAGCVYILINTGKFEINRITLFFVFFAIVTALFSVFFSQNILDITTRTLMSEQDVIFSKNLFYSSSAQYVLTCLSFLFFVSGIFSSKFVDKLK